MILDDVKKEQLLRTFYHERLMPLAEKARATGVEFFPMGPDESTESYYVERKDDGNYVHEINANDLAGELGKLWGRGGLAELADLAGAMIELAEIIKEIDEAPEDVSPFVYAMF